jgi:hypothetical protein
MLRYKLRTLLILLAALPMLIGGIVNLARAVIEARESASRKICRSTLTIGVPGYYLPTAPPTRQSDAVWRSRP